MMSPNCLLWVPLAETLDAAHATGSPHAVVDRDGSAPTFEHDGVRRGARFGRDTCVHYAVDGNFNRDAGTVMLWFKPDWDAYLQDTLGRILWDLRVEHGSLVPNDPSQRWALVYPNPAGKGTGRPGDTLQRWRFCIATNRNQYVIGTTQKRPDQRTRQAVFGSQQHFKANEWMHLAVTWTKEQGVLFVNGCEDGRGALPEGLPWRPLPERMQLGAIPSWINAGTCGVLADFRVYSIPLDRAQLQLEAGITKGGIEDA